MKFSEIPAFEPFRLSKEPYKTYFKFYDDEYEMRNLDGKTWLANAVSLSDPDRFVLLDPDTEVLYG